MKFQIHIKSYLNSLKTHKNIQPLRVRQFIKVICFAGMQVLICKWKAKSLLQLHINTISHFPQVNFNADNREMNAFYLIYLPQFISLWIRFSYMLQSDSLIWFHLNIWELFEQKKRYSIHQNNALLHFNIQYCIHKLNY